MGMEIPEQCRACRHVRLQDNDALCAKRRVQHCERDNDEQRLMMKPGICRLLNEANTCDLFAPPQLHWLRTLLRR